MNRRRLLQMLAGVPFVSSILATADGVARESDNRRCGASHSRDPTEMGAAE
jgi:hypothetical protein